MEKTTPTVEEIKQATPGNYTFQDIVNAVTKDLAGRFVEQWLAEMMLIQKKSRRWQMKRKGKPGWRHEFKRANDRGLSDWLASA